MKILLSLTFILTLAFNISLGQVIRINCNVVDRATGKPIPYVNLGVAGKSIGTNSNEHGEIDFQIIEYDLDSSDKFIFSSVGYKKQELNYDQLKKLTVIKLEEQIQELNEVVITAPVTKPKILGKDNKGALTHLMIYGVNSPIDDGLSQEFGVIINSNKSCIINSFNFYISSNNFEHLKFRFSLYEFNNDSIQENLIDQDIYFEAEPNYIGWIKVDLKPYNIVLTAQDFVATAQLIEMEQLNNKAILSMPIVTPSPFNGFVYRDKNQNNWRINKSANPSIYLEANCSRN